MVDFRYHLVSIIAVFLALAVGIVLGTAALNGPIQDDLNRNITRLSSDKRALEGNVTDLRAQVQSADSFAETLGPGLVAGDLTDQRVLLVTTAQTPGGLDDRIVALLDQAGATVTGRLRLLPDLSDPNSRALVDDLSAQVVPAGLTLPQAEPVQRAVAELAAALVRTPGGDAIEPAAAAAIVSAFSEAKLVSFTPVGDAPPRATLALVLSGGQLDGDPPPEQVRQQEAVLYLANELDDRSSGAVVAGPDGSAGPQALVGQVRADSGANGRISTVDNVDRGTGLVAAVLALAEQASGGTGQYGAGAGAGAALPSPAPR